MTQKKKFFDSTRNQLHDELCSNTKTDRLILLRDILALKENATNVDKFEYEVEETRDNGAFKEVSRTVER